jgi:SAM-dependent methyltransferase
MMTEDTSPDHTFEEHAYRRAERDGHRFARHGAEAKLDPDIRAILSWDEFPDRGGPVLELGCGDGFVTRFLVDLGLEVVAVDCSHTAIARARRNLDEPEARVTFQVGDVCKLDAFEDASFGTVLDSHCLHCVVTRSRRLGFLRECRRLLAADGLLFIVTMAEQSMHWIEPGGPEDVRYECDERGCYVESRVYLGAHRRAETRIFVTEARLREEIAEAGLQIVRFQKYTHEEDPDDLAFLVMCRAEGDHAIRPEAP